MLLYTICDPRQPNEVYVANSEFQVFIKNENIGFKWIMLLSYDQLNALFSVVVNMRKMGLKIGGSLSGNVRYPLRKCNVRYQAFFIKM